MSGKLTVLQNVGLAGVSPKRATLTINRSGPQGPSGPPGGSATYYQQAAISQQPWSQGDIDLDNPSGTTDAVVALTDNPYFVQATINFTATADVLTEATTGAPLFLIDAIFRSLDAGFTGWIWGLGGQSLTTPVQGTFGGLPYVGSVDRDGRILDADGNQMFRTITNGDTLTGTITGLFNAD